MNIQQFLEEEAKKHLAHVGGDERTIPALVMLLKDVSNKVLDEVKRGLQAQGSIAIDGGQFMYSKDNVDNLLDQLRLK